MSNADIAQALFVTVKTVEMHLGHAYNKLNLRGRTQLAAALGDRPMPAESELATRIAEPTTTHA
jgi:DNA-binding NarL/FixJ family response regulator